MLSLTDNKDKNLKKIAKIIIDKDKKTKKFIYLTNNNDGSNEIKLQKNESLQILPDKDVVEKIYISGVSGSGKSTWVSKWLKEYKKMFKNDIFLFSSVDSDAVLDKYKPVRIPINEDLIIEPIEPYELRDSLVIFDDIDTTRNKRFLITLNNLRDWLLECGRHHDTRMLITSHLLSNYSSTRRVLNEATTVVLFPKANGSYHIKNFLKHYCGFDKHQIKKFINLNSRWVAVRRGYPMIVYYEKGMYVVNTSDNV